MKASIATASDTGAVSGDLANAPLAGYSAG